MLLFSIHFYTSLQFTHCFFFLHNSLKQFEYTKEVTDAVIRIRANNTLNKRKRAKTKQAMVYKILHTKN